MLKIDGKKIAAELIHELIHKQRPAKSLAVILVSDLSTSLGRARAAASLSFIKQKEKVAKELGVRFNLYHLNKSINQEELERKIEELSANKTVGGIVVQLPLPEKFNRDKVLAKIDLKKNVDDGLAVSVVKDILKEVGWELAGKTVAVVGQGFLVGNPIVRWLDKKIKNQKSKIKIKMADINTKNLESFLSDVDLIISGVGKENLIDPTWLKEGVGVIDFGYPADFNNSKFKIQNSRLSFYTPTPGGTGPILVAELFRNFYDSNAD